MRRAPADPPTSLTALVTTSEAPDRCKAFGRWGEDVAARFLGEQYGLRAVAHNLRLRGCEIDLLVRRRSLWVAVEVKARRHHPAPERLVDETDTLRIARALAKLAPGLRPRPRQLRVDVVAVQPVNLVTARILHLPGTPFLRAPVEPD